MSLPAALARRRERVLAIMDQGFTGLGNFIALTLLARALPTAQYAAIGAAIALHFVLFGFHRANVVLPFILSAKDVGDRPDAGAWCWLAFRIAAVQAVVMLLAGGAMAVAGASAFAQQVVLCAAIQSPPLLLQEFGKRWLYQNGRPGTVALGSAIGFGVVLAIVVPMAWAGGTWLTASLALGSGAAVAAAFAFARQPPGMAARRVPAAALLGPRRRFAMWQSATNIPYVLYNTGYTLILAAVAGPATTAGFTAIRTLLSPTASLISAVDATDKVRAVAAYRTGGPHAAKRSVDRTRWLLLALNGPALLVLAAAAGPIQTLLLGGAYYHPVEMAVLALYFLLLSVNQPSESFMVVQEAGRSLLVSRCISAAIAIALLLLLAPRLGLMGAVLALVGAQTANFVALQWLGRRSLRGMAPLDEATA